MVLRSASLIALALARPPRAASTRMARVISSAVAVAVGWIISVHATPQTAPVKGHDGGGGQNGGLPPVMTGVAYTS